MHKRTEMIINNTVGRVLHIGCLQYPINKIDNIPRGALESMWVHGAISERFNTVGIDIDEDVLRLRDYGYEVYCMDAQNFKLNETYDTIIATELIEHLSCPKSFLKCVKEHLEPNGRIILTTPNMFDINYWLSHATGRLNQDKGHKCWYDKTTLTQLVEGEGFSITRFEYINVEYENTTKLGWLLHRIGIPLTKRFLPEEFFAQGLFIIMEVR